MADTVLYSADGKIGIVTLNRPEKLNALSMDMRLALARELKRADEDAAISVSHGCSLHLSPRSGAEKPKIST